MKPCKKHKWRNIEFDFWCERCGTIKQYFIYEAGWSYVRPSWIKELKEDEDVRER